MIKLERDSGWADRARVYKVMLDGDLIGEIKDGEEKEFECPEGTHEIFLKIYWCRSNTVNFQTEGEIVYFECGSSLRGWKVILIDIYIIFLRNKYLWLRKNP